jgi:hypothetical protein
MKTIVLSMFLAVGWIVANAAVAAESCRAPGACTEVQTCGAAGHCACCGRTCQCEKHCQVVCQMKEVKKTVWVVKCEDFCAPLPNCGLGCRKDCNGCKSCAAGGVEPTCCEGCGKKRDPCAAEKNKCYVPPKCGKVRTRKVLEKKEVVCMVPSYKCVVVYTCPNCCGSEKCDGQAPATPVKPALPPPPAGQTTDRAPLPPELSLTR